MPAIAISKRVFMRLTRDIDCKMTPDASIIIVKTRRKVVEYAESEYF